LTNFLTCFQISMMHSTGSLSLDVFVVKIWVSVVHSWITEWNDNIHHTILRTVIIYEQELLVGFF